MQDRRASAGLLLIAVGALFLLGNYFDLERASLAIVGLILLLAYFVLGRQAGFLIPGGILTGLGLGIYVSHAGVLGKEEDGGIVLLGLGVGFLIIWALERRQRWAIIPGSIISVVGILLLATTLGGIVPWEVWRAIGKWWPIIFVALGLWILLQQLVGRRR